MFKHDASINLYVWLRSSISDILDLTLDSIIFVTLAFFGDNVNNSANYWTNC